MPETIDIDTPYGQLTLDQRRDKKMAQRLVQGQYPNADLIPLVERFVSPGNTLLDIGAHVGTFSLPFAPTVRVIAFEPVHDTFALLEKNMGRVPGTHDVRNIGLGAQSGSASVAQRSASNAGAQTLAPGEGVVVSTLDAEVSQADFIKIDVEGMEEDVLRGGVQLIERCHPTILFEVHLSQLRSHGSSPRALESFLRQRGYTLFFPLEKVSVMHLSRVWSLELLAALIAPRAWLLRTDSAPFDVFAVAGRPLPVPQASFASAVAFIVRRNVRKKMRRVRNIFAR